MRELASAEIDRSHFGPGGGYSDKARASDEQVLVSGPALADPPPDGAALFAFDRPSALKTEGNLVLVKSDQKLLISDFSGSVPAKLSRLTGPGWYGGGQLLLAGDRALILIPARQSPVRTELVLVDLHDPRRPAILQQETIQGEYLTAARSDGMFRVVVRSTPDIHSAWSAKGDPLPASQLKAKAARFTPNDWLPTRQIMDASGATTSSGPLLDCTQVRRPAQDVGAELLTVLTIDPAGDDALAAAAPIGIVTGSDVVTFSPARLLVATTAAQGDAHTSIHEFDVTQRETEYLGSGTVDGYVDDPGAMSPRAGILRVVTTTVAPWQGEQDYGPSAAHAITVLTEKPGGLVPTATATITIAPRKLGVIRWFDDLLAVAPRPVRPEHFGVTENTDFNAGSGPLRLVDLLDPTEPEIAAALDLPDDTAQLVPFGAGHVVAIGTRPAAPAVNSTPVISTYDLADLKAPKKLDSLGLGTGTLFGDDALAWPSRNLIVAVGSAGIDSVCAGGDRCLAPTPAVCEQAGGCRAYEQDPRAALGAVGITVGADGRLQVTRWVTGHRGFGPVLRVGDHLAVLSLVGVTMLDPDLTALGTVPIRKAAQP
jgi:Beta propeller domain